MTELRTRHILPALLVAAVLHAWGAMLLFDDRPAPGAAGTGRGGLEIGMGLAGGAPGRVGSQAATPTRPAPGPTPAATAEPAPVSETAATAPPGAPVADPDSTEAKAVETVPALPDQAPEPVASASAQVPSAAEPVAVRTSAVPAPAPPPPSSSAAPELAEPASPPPEAGAAEPVTEALLPSPREAVETGARPGPEVVEDTSPESDASPSRLTETPAAATVRADTVAPAEPDPPDRQAAVPSRAPTPRTRPARAEPQPVRSARAEPTPDRTERRTREAAGPDPSDQENDAAAPASETGRDGRTTDGEATGRGGNAGTGQTASLGGDPGARRDYMAQIAAILAREKRYPRRARVRREEGTGHLRFTLDASGRVTAQAIARSTGHSSLDEEIAALLDRAGPLPPIPPEVGRDTLEIVVPIRFRLR